MCRVRETCSRFVFRCIFYGCIDIGYGQTMKEEVMSLQATVSSVHAPGYGKGREDDQAEWARQEQQVRLASMLYDANTLIIARHRC
jgi:hypothetical protein